uniref:DUF4371 domain-containing protein n=1 Tax=Latimeria chalumnae TaxID=7897 RepID=H3A0C4_LATCH
VTKKHKLENENRQFQDKYCLVQDRSVIICLLWKNTIAVPKEFNLKRHYESKQFKGELQKQKIDSLKQGLSLQQTLFTRGNAEVEIATQISSMIATFSQLMCMMVASQKFCPESTNKCENVSLNRMIIQHRISSLSDNISAQLKDIASKFVYFSLAANKSTDVTSTAQLLIFVHGITADFEVYEELVGMSSLQRQTKVSDILNGL